METNIVKKISFFLCIIFLSIELYAISTEYIKIKFRGNTDNNFYSISEITAFKNNQPLTLSVASAKTYSAINDELILDRGMGNMFDGANVDGGTGSATTLNPSDERDSLLLEVKFQQVYDIDSVKVGMYDGGGRVFENVEVSLSFNGIEYQTSIPTDIANGNQTFHTFPNTEISPYKELDSIRIQGSTSEAYSMNIGDSIPLYPDPVFDTSLLWGGRHALWHWSLEDNSIVSLDSLENDSMILVGLSNGETKVYLTSSSLRDSITIIVENSTSTKEKRKGEIISDRLYYLNGKKTTGDSEFKNRKERIILFEY